jgi:hypothetical protein
VLGGTTAGFPEPRNKTGDINSKDSLINYLRHPAGLLTLRSDHSSRHRRKRPAKHCRLDS